MKTGHIDTDQRHRIATAEIKQRIVADLGRRRLHRGESAKPGDTLEVENIVAAGAGGEAISLVSADEIDQLSDIESLIRRKLPREIIAGFEPAHEVPDTKTTPRQDIPRKPRSNRVKAKSNRSGSKTENRGNNQPGKESRSASPGNSKKKQGQKKRRWQTGKKQPTRARLAA